MASLNTLTGLYPVIYNAVDVVSREKVGAIMATNRDASYEMAGENQTVRSPVVPTASVGNITPGAYAPDAGGQTIGYVDMTISKFRKVDIQWTGEEQKAVGSQANVILQNQFAQAFRAISKEISQDISTAALAGASRASGAYNTVPFGTANDLSDFAAQARILDDNGAPDGDVRHLVLNAAAMQNLRGKQSELFKVNEAGTDDLLRNGAISRVQGFWLHQDTFLGQSAKTVGTGTGYVINGAGNTAAGSVTLTAKTGSGTIVAGDVVTIGGHKYVVVSGLAAPGTFTIQAPGLRAAVSDGDTITIESAWRASFACSSDAIQLAVRQPAMPAGGDAAADVMMVTDPVSGLVYQIALYKGYRQVHIEVGAAWGVKVVKPDHVSLLLGGN